jgi:hypothetical protein
MLLEQMRAKWEAAGRGAADERAPLLANWYLGNRHAWWEAMEMAKAEPARPAVTWQPIETAPKERIHGDVQYVLLCARYPDTNIQTDCVYSWWDGAGWARWHHTFPPSLWMAVPALPSQPEPARPAVTREAVMLTLTEPLRPECRLSLGDCRRPDKCTCRRTIDAIMALIGGEA